MPAEVDRAITEYVRHEVIGKREGKFIADKLGVSTAWVTNVRNGRQTVGRTAMSKIADVFFDGSLKELSAKARKWARQHPELLIRAEDAEEETPLIVAERAVAVLVKTHRWPQQIAEERVGGLWFRHRRRAALSARELVDMALGIAAIAETDAAGARGPRPRQRRA